MIETDYEYTLDEIEGIAEKIIEADDELQNDIPSSDPLRI